MPDLDNVLANAISTEGKVFYHGSPATGIGKFVPSVRGSLGRGVYMSTDLSEAETWSSPSGSIYELKVPNLYLFDLTGDLDKTADVLRRFGESLISKYGEDTILSGAAKRIMETPIAMSIMIELGSSKLNEELIAFMRGLGYEGLNYNVISLVFNPDRVTVSKELK